MTRNAAYRHWASDTRNLTSSPAHHARSFITRRWMAPILVLICRYCLNWTKSISENSQKNKIVAIKCHILRLKCTKFCFGGGVAPDVRRELKASLDPLAGYKRSYF